MTAAHAFLTHLSPLPPHDRVAVSGVTGIGKSTLCRQLSALWDLPYTELDSLFHGAGWTQRPTFRDDVRAIAESDRWISELQYMNNGGGWLLADRMQTLLWLDYPRRIARTRLLRRTLARGIDRRELWPGTSNIEPPLWTILRDPDHILRWEMKTHRTWRDELIPKISEKYPDVTIVRFGHPRELEQWLDRARAAVDQA